MEEGILVGECILVVDQLNIGDGSREEYELIKDAEIVGRVIIESKHSAALVLIPDVQSEPEKAAPIIA